MSTTHTAFGSRAYSDAMDSAWREVRSQLTNGLPLSWMIQRARLLYRKAHRDEGLRCRGGDRVG